MSAKNCIVCGAPATKKCSGCQSAFYCTQEHQKKDWRAHKDYCLVVQKAGDNTFDGILFSATETKPRMIKIPYVWLGYGPGTQAVDLRFWFKHPSASITRTCFLPKQCPIVRPGLSFYYDDYFALNKLPLNRCIANITAGRSGDGWYGNVVGLRVLDVFRLTCLGSANMEEDMQDCLTFFSGYKPDKRLVRTVPLDDDDGHSDSDPIV